MTKEVTSVRIVIRLAWVFLLSGALLFGSAASLKWLEAWLYLILSISCNIPIVLWLKKGDPHLLKDRLGFDKKSPQPVDRIFLFLYYIFVIILIAFPGLDAVRFQWSKVPLLTKVIGFVLVPSACFILFLVIKENPYLSRAVEVHQDREHKVVTTGPYRWVRHPWYVGLILFFFSIPLALGSLYDLIPAGILTLLLLFRTIIEDKTLYEELPGYKEYCEKTRYRLLPYIW